MITARPLTPEAFARYGGVLTLQLQGRGAGLPVLQGSRPDVPVVLESMQTSGG